MSRFHPPRRFHPMWRSGVHLPRLRLRHSRAHLPSGPLEHQAGADLAEVLAGAGLQGVAVTPELARSFGEILHVVVSGVMDVLKARHEIKDEFRMRMTHLRVADNIR